MGSLDPYARPAGELSETEKRILVAAFAAPALAADSLGRSVQIVLGLPVLLSENTKSDVLVVSIQVVTSPAIVDGVIGSGPRLSAGTATRIRMIHSGLPIQQILLPKEQLWFVPAAIIGPSSLVVTEVTP